MRRKRGTIYGEGEICSPGDLRKIFAPAKKINFMNSNGALVLSLDFELLWGIFDKVDWRERKTYFQNTRRLIPEILHLFEKNQMSCTWATVGMLFNENWDEWNLNIPSVLPEYEVKGLSAYKYGKSIQSKETEELCFAPDLIEKIKQTDKQEIGTHTYSHYYCLEPGQSLESFQSDLKTAKKVAEKFDINFKSLVFPRNQYNVDYLKVCEEIGIHTVRTNPDAWYWKNTEQGSLPQKIFRTGDAYIGLKNKSYVDVPEVVPGVIGQKASRLLRANSGKKILDRKRLQRILSEMSKAAKNREIYHLWWHPHNFGGNPRRSLEELGYILKHFKSCQKEFGFRSLSMEELSEVVKRKSNG